MVIVSLGLFFIGQLFTAGPSTAGQSRPTETVAVVPWPTLDNLPVRVEVINPISGHDLDTYEKYLVLSAEQARYVRALYEQQYLRDKKVVETRFAPELVRSAQRFFERTFRESHEFGAFFRRFRDSEEAFCAAVEQADSAFLTQIQLALAEPQLERFPRVVLHRQRGQCLPLRPIAIRRAGVDFSAMLDDLGLSEDDRASAEHVLIEYEQALTPLLVRADRLYRQNRALINQSMVDSRFDEQGRPRDPADAQTQRIKAQLLAERDARRNLEAQAALDIARVNDQFLPRLMEALSPVAASNLRRVYLGRSYPRVYPDVVDVAPLYAMIIEHESLSDEHRALLTIYWRQYRERYAAACGRLEQLSQAWQEQYARTGASNGWPEHEQELAALLTERNKTGTEFMKLLKSLLPSETLLAFQSAMDEQEAGLSRVVGAGRGFDPR